MEILWEHALPTNENSQDYQYESPVFIKNDNIFFICKSSEESKKDSLYIIDKCTGILKEKIELKGHTLIPSKCFFETVGEKTVIYTGNLWTYTCEDGLLSLCKNLFEYESKPLPENLSAYDIAAIFEDRRQYEITSHLVYENYFIFSNRYSIYCVDVKENTLKWQIYSPNSTSLCCGSISPFEDKISFYGNDKLLFIDISNGTITDEIKIPRISKLFCPMRMDDGTLLMGFTNWSNAGVLRYNPETKKVLWKSKRSLEGPLCNCTLFRKNNLVYWLKNETALICVNADSGEEVFCAPTRPWLYTLPFFTKGSIIFGTSGANGFLTNINAASGDLKWSMPLKNGCAYFAMHGETVIVGDFDKKLYQIDLQSGEVLQELYVGGEVVGNIASENGFIYTVVWGNESEPIKLIKVKII